MAPAIGSRRTQHHRAYAHRSAQENTELPLSAFWSSKIYLTSRMVTPMKLLSSQRR